MTVEEIVAQLAGATAHPAPHPAAVQPPPAAAQPQFAPPPAAQPQFAPPPSAAAAAAAAAAPSSPPPAAIVPPNAPVTGTIAPPPVAPPPAITLSPEQWAAYSSTQQRIVELEAAEATRAREAAAEQVRSLQARGQVEQAFALQRQQHEAMMTAANNRAAELEKATNRYALDGELARTLAAFPLVVGGAEQLTTLIRHEFDVQRTGDTIVVRSKDFRSVPEFVAATLARPEYSHFLPAQNPGGGTGGTLGSQSAPAAPGMIAPPAAPQNLSEEVIAYYKAQGIGAGNGQATGGSVITDEGKTRPLPAASFGLGRARTA